MVRMRRRLLTMAAGASLLVSIVLLLLGAGSFVRGLSAADGRVEASLFRSDNAELNCGAVRWTRLETEAYRGIPASPWQLQREHPRYPVLSLGPVVLGFQWVQTDQAFGTGMRLRSVTVPLYFPLLLGLVLPVIWFRRRRRWRWPAQGRCARCGYDLRGTRAAGRTECPECGQALAAD